MSDKTPLKVTFWLRYLSLHWGSLIIKWSQYSTVLTVNGHKEAVSHIH